MVWRVKGVVPVVPGNWLIYLFFWLESSDSRDRYTYGYMYVDCTIQEVSTYVCMDNIQVSIATYEAKLESKSLTLVVTD